jgi:hypothetical protein
VGHRDPRGLHRLPAEFVADAANLPHDERFLSTFFTSRNVGVSMTNTYLGERATWTVGWFNDW